MTRKKIVSMKVFIFLLCLILTSCLTDTNKSEFSEFLTTKGFTNVSIHEYSFIGCERSPDDYMFKPSVHSIGAMFSGYKKGHKVKGVVCCSPDFCDIHLR